MFGRKRPKRRSNFITVFGKVEEVRESMEGATINFMMVYPDTTGRTGRARIVIYTDRGELNFNTSDCDIEVYIKDTE